MLFSMKCTPGETALGMPKSGNSVERAKQFSIYFVLTPSWVNKRLFYSGGPRWLGTIIHTKHHGLRLSTKHNCRLSLRKWWYGCPSFIGQHIVVGPCPTLSSAEERWAQRQILLPRGACPTTLIIPPWWDHIAHPSLCKKPNRASGQECRRNQTLQPRDESTHRETEAGYNLFSIACFLLHNFLK